MAGIWDLIGIIAIGVIGVYVWQSGALSNIGPNLSALRPMGGGGGAITQGAGCPGGQNCGPCRPQSGGIRCECDDVKHASYEATYCGTWSGDDMSIKMWGPQHHDSSDCCWCILSVSPEGEFGMRQEGPHPDTSSKTSEGGGSAGGKPSCIKATISPGPKGAHVEGWGLVGGGWKKFLTYDGPCGDKKKSTKPVASQQVAFRCDGDLKMKCATVRPLGAGGAVTSGGNGNGNGGGNGEEDEESKYARAYYSYLFAPKSSWDRIGYY